MENAFSIGVVTSLGVLRGMSIDMVRATRLATGQRCNAYTCGLYGSSCSRSMYLCMRAQGTDTSEASVIEQNAPAKLCRPHGCRGGLPEPRAKNEVHAGLEPATLSSPPTCRRLIRYHCASRPSNHPETEKMIVDKLRELSNSTSERGALGPVVFRY